MIAYKFVSQRRWLWRFLVLGCGALILTGCTPVPGSYLQSTPSVSLAPRTTPPVEETPVLTAPSSSATIAKPAERALSALEQSEHALVRTCMMGGSTGTVTTYRGDEEITSDALLAAVLPALATRAEPFAAIPPIAADRAAVDVQIAQVGGRSKVESLLAELGDDQSTTTITTARQACSDINEVALGNFLDDRTRDAYWAKLREAASQAPTSALEAAGPDSWTIVGAVVEDTGTAGAVAIASGVHWSTVVTVSITGTDDPLNICMQAVRILLEG